MKLTKLGFVIPPINNFKGCVETMCSIKTEHPYEIFIEEQWRAHKPLSQAWNDGFDRAVAAGCEYIFILNDDILFAPDGVDNLVKEYDRLEKEKIVLVSSNNKMGELADPYHILSQEKGYKVPTEVADHPNFSCFMVKKDFFDKVGRFDENFNPAWFEDNDMHYRIHLLGYRAICTVASSCIHFGGVATAMLPPEKKSSEHSRQYFTKKWGSMNRDLNENYRTPYNNPELTPRDWTPNYE